MKSDIPYLNKYIITEVEKFSNGILSRKNDLRLILNWALKEKREEVFADLAFTGKYITGLIKVLNKGQNIPEVENLDQIKKDLSSNFESFINKLKEIILPGDEQIKKNFEAEYFTLTPQSFNNLKMLAGDFAMVKVYLNHLKHGIKNN